MNRTSVYKRIVGLIIRFVLFSLVLGLGTFAALVVDEQSGLAATTLPDASIQTVAGKDDVLYVNIVDETQQTGSLYRSQDHGRSWQYVGSGPGVPIKALAIHPVDKNVLYAGAEGGPSVNANNIWTSGNGGQNWHRFYLKLPSTAAGLIPDVTALAVDPNQPDELYVGTAGQGVYRYQAAPDGYGYELVGGLSSPSGYVKGLVVSPDSRVYALTTESLMVIDVEDPRSEADMGDGDIWHKVKTLPDLAVSLAVDPTNPQILYAGTIAYGAYRSTDGGQTWQAINEGLGWQPGILLRVSAISVDEANPQHLVLATAYNVGSHLAGEGIYESHNTGQSWVKVADTQAVVNRLIVDASGVYAVTADGLVRYGDPIPAAPTTPLTGLNSLTQPSGVQILILSLTLILAGLILVGRVEWVSNRQFTHSLLRR